MPQENTAGIDRSLAAAKVFRRYLASIPAAIVVAAIYFGRPVLLPFAVAMLLAFALAPFVDRLRRIGFGRTTAVLTAALVSIIFIIGLGGFVTSKSLELAGQLPLYESNLVEKIQSIRGTTDQGSVIGRAATLLRDLRAQFAGKPSNPTLPMPAPDLAQGAPAPPVAVEIKQPETAPLELAASVLQSLLMSVLAASITLVFVIFILLYKEDIRDRFIRLAGSQDIQRATLLLDEGAKRLARYLLTQTAINAGFGVLIGIGTWLIGLPGAALWGVMVTLFRFVPYIGVPLASILPIALALAVDPGWTMALSTLGLFAIGEIIFGQAVEPVLFSRGLGLSPPAVVIAASFWTWIWGPVGLLLSTPLTMCLLVLGRHVPHLQFLDVLLGDKPPLSAEEALYIRLLGDDADEAAVEGENYIKEHSVIRYYDDVVLKALMIAQADVHRGALDAERIDRIRSATEDLIQNLSDIEPKPKTEGLPVNHPSVAGPVYCIGGRGLLDEAPALVLAHLLDRAGVDARLIKKGTDSEASLHRVEVEDAKTMCLCYLDASNVNRARYIIRRLRRRNPNAVIVTAFWGHSNADANVTNAVGSTVVTKFEEAVGAVLATANGDAQSEAA